MPFTNRSDAATPTTGSVKVTSMVVRSPTTPGGAGRSGPPRFEVALQRAQFDREQEIGAGDRAVEQLHDQDVGSSSTAAGRAGGWPRTRPAFGGQGGSDVRVSVVRGRLVQIGDVSTVDPGDKPVVTQRPQLQRGQRGSVGDDKRLTQVDRGVRVPHVVQERVSGVGASSFLVVERSRSRRPGAIFEGQLPQAFVGDEASPVPFWKCQTNSWQSARRPSAPAPCTPGQADPQRQDGVPTRRIVRLLMAFSGSVLTSQIPAGASSGMTCRRLRR